MFNHVQSLSLTILSGASGGSGRNDAFPEPWVGSFAQIFGLYSDVESFCHHPRNGSLVENNDRPSFPAFGDGSRFASGRSTKQAARDVRWSTKSSSMAIIFNDMPIGVPQIWCLIQVHIWIRKCNLWQDHWCHRSPSCWVVILWGDCWKVGWYPNWLNKLVPKIGQVG